MTERDSVIIRPIYAWRFWRVKDWMDFEQKKAQSLLWASTPCNHCTEEE